jgi:hypothetical protein
MLYRLVDFLRWSVRVPHSLKETNKLDNQEITGKAWILLEKLAELGLRV